MSPRNKARLYCLLIGSGLAVVGIVIGLFSHTEPYARAAGTVSAYISGVQDNHYTSYMTLANDSRIYIIKEPNFSPTFGFNSLGDGALSLMYLPSSEQDVDVSSTDGTTLKGKGYDVYDVSVTSTHTDYQTDAFASSPAVHVSDYWVYGSLLIALAAAVVLFGLILPLSTLNTFLYTLCGLVAGPIIFFFFIGYFEGNGLNGNSWKQALADDVATAIICAAIGVLIGFLLGVIQTMRKEYLIDLE